MFNNFVKVVLMSLLLLPVLAGATNMQVSSSVSPVSGGTITPNGIKYSAKAITYTVAPNTGWSLASVLIDGVDAAGSQIVDSTHYVVAFDTSKVHTIKASYSQRLFSITATAGAGGTIQVTGGGNVNITPGSSRDVVIAPDTGYRIATLTINGSPVTVAAPTVAYTKSFVNIQSNITANATFSVIPTATVYAGANKTVSGSSTGLIGSVSSNLTPTSYLWQVSSGPRGSFTNGNTLTPTFNYSELGTYTITLTVTVGGIAFTSSPATITVSTSVMEASKNCTTCHAGQTQVTDWLASPHAKSNLSSVPSCPACHMPNNEVHPGQITSTMVYVCITCHTDSPQAHPVVITNTCITCHNPHTAAASGGCNSCHDSPPNTASHQKHYASNAVGVKYGDLRITQSFTNYSSGYVFGCGNCHPMDIAYHNNGVVNVELYNPLATIGSLKAKNPVTATYVTGPEVFLGSNGIPYTKGTCSNIYCHSYNDSTTIGAIGDGDVNWEAKTVITRIYKNVTWGVTVLSCSGCHGNPTQTSSLTNDGGAGDSHSWIDEYGYQNLHTYNMSYAPVSCTYCHNDTVKQMNSYTVDGMGVRTLSGVPISNFSKHVNGSNDVAFDKQNAFIYSSAYSGDKSMSLSAATYDSSTKNCLNVSCHRAQKVVKWGTPYRWYYNECNVCHSY
jgi:predicted CxxxxCH...CXXCH cytochrome family protein